MDKRAKRALINALHHDIAEYVAELQEADDLDLWEEAAAKLCDVLLVYRRSQLKSMVTMIDGRKRTIDEIAFAHAVAEVFPDLLDDEWPVWMERGDA